jgi:hypothetical protein
MDVEVRKVAWEPFGEQQLPEQDGSRFRPEEWKLLRQEIQTFITMEIEKRTNEIPVMNARTVDQENGLNDDDAPDPEEDKGIWNLNAMSVATWKSSCWPKAQRWNYDSEHFEPQVTRHLRVRSTAQLWIENHLCVFFFTVFPLVFVFLEMSILAGLMDQGTNLKTHIYGDGFYQSPIWRYSGSAYLRLTFVPVLDANGTKVGMTSNTNAFGHSLLRDRPASEALQCLDENYLMPFNAYQVWTPEIGHVAHCRDSSR